MRTFKILISALTAVVFFSSCANDSDSGSQHKIKLENKPQVIDFLKGKSKAEILKMKYKELKAICSLIAVKTTRDQIADQAVSFSAEITPQTPVPPPAPEAPVKNPSENSLTYDLKLQQIVDKELTQETKSKLISSLDGKTLNIDITFKPVVFHESLNLDINKKKYVMKHTPVLSYFASYELVQDGTSTFATTEAKVYEKIEGQRNTIVAVRAGAAVDADKYNFVLDCKLDRTINTEDKDLATEFENQWVIVDCKTPQNNTEKTVCTP